MKILKTQSLLGEGLSYFKKRKRIVCFDILDRKAYFIDPDSNWSLYSVNLPFRGSCAFETVDGKALVAGDHGLYQTNDFKSFDKIIHHDLAEDMRMNDGREDPDGRFWYSSMSMNGDRPDGEIYCFDPLVGKSITMFRGFSIPNAICFDPDRHRGYCADSSTGLIWHFDYRLKQPSFTLFLDLSRQKFVPDGAVVDAEGCFWNAQWGGARVSQYSASGQFMCSFSFPASQVASPLLYKNFLIVTSARAGLNENQRVREPNAGNIFVTKL